jgi:nucleoside-diphosphate-sugar epimerase
VFKRNNCWWLVVNDLCKMAYFQKAIVLQSDGTPLRDFIHSSDVCSGVQMVIETSERHPIFNLSSGSTHSIMDIAQMVKSVYTLRYGIDISINAKKRSKDIQTSKYKIDNSLIRSIGFKPEVPLEEGINKIFEYLESEKK